MSESKAFYYCFTNPFLNEEGMVTMGEIPEIIFLLLMPFFFTPLSIKKMILIGSIYAGNVVEQYQIRSDVEEVAGQNWLSIWIIPAGLPQFCSFCLLSFLKI